MATEAKNTNYWISSSALYIQLNAMGEPDYIQCSVVSGASILCYMQGIPGLEYDAGHNYQRWPLAAYPSVFPDSERKYIYVAIPRTSTADNNTAVVVYPSERIDLYGYSIANPDKLVGDERFYYIYLQGIISEVKTDADGKTRKRDWLQHVDCGKLNTDESFSSGIDGTWWKYNSVTDSISFLKTILSATFDTLIAKVAKITKLFLGGSELNGVANDLSLETDNTKVVTPLYLGQFGVKHFLAKDKDDVAHGAITFEKVQKFLAGLNVGDSNSENGGSWTPDAEGRSHLITDYLEVRMKAIFEELVIKKTSTIGGKEIISPAGGVVAHKVEEVTVTYNNVSQKAYRCYFLAEQEDDAVDNDFAIGDQVRSESFNVRKGTYHKVGNHFYWRLVIGRNEDPVELEGKKYHYIDLSDTDCATASDVPANGDVLNQCGNRTDVERQNCLIFSAVDTYSPSIGLYHGINSYSFSNKEYVEYGVNKQTNKAFFNVYGDMYVGDRPTKENGYEGSSYIKFDSATKQVVIKGKLSAKSTVDGKELSQFIKENSEKGLTEEQVNNIINNSQVITDLQNQVDGAIETWFYEGVPTLTNAPASDWKTDKDKDTHLGDLYYDNKTGKAYRFAKDGNTYKWTIITDTDIAKALSDASKAQETADGKMTVFATQPTPPYQLGDIWVNATYPSDGSTYKNEVLRCQTDKKAGSQFAIGDWIKASKYTDDTVANAAKKAAEDAQKAARTAQTNITNLDKTVTTNKESFDNYVKDGYLEPSEIAAMAQDSKRLEDDFAATQKSYDEVKGAEVLKNTKELTNLNAAFATLSKAKTELVTYLSDISARYNKADTNGKATIVSAVETKFTNFQSAYSAFYDKLGLANAYITNKIYGDLGVVIGDVTSLAYLKKALMDAPDTEINGGLVLTSLIGLRDTGGNTTAGINGITEKSAKGGGIAAWFGGEMVDKDYNDGSKTPANTIFRFDGSGYVAGGAIWWGTDGRVHADPTSFIISEKNLGAYLTFFEPTWKSGSAGTSVADLVSLKPNAPFSKLGVSGDASFEGAITFHGIKFTYDATNKAIKVDGNLYATGGITAYGASDGASGGGGLNGSVKSYSDALKLTSESLSEIASAYSIKALSSRIDSISTELGGLNLSWNNITGKPSTFAPSAHTHKWTEITNRITKVSQLTNDAGYLTSHQSLAGYATQSWVNGKGYITSSGSITGNAATATKLKSTVKIFGNDFDGTNNISGSIQVNESFVIGVGNEIFNSKDTLFINFANRGGQNVSICNGTGNVAIGGNDFTNKLNVSGDTSISGTLYASKIAGYLDYSYVTNHPSSFPASDVHAWAKASTKPSYSWNEINGRPTVVSAFTNDAKYLSKTLSSVNDANDAVGDVGFSVFRAEGNVAHSNKYVDGFITTYNWGGNYCSQLFIDADPTYGMMIRHRGAEAKWNSWKEIITENNIMNQHVNISDNTYNVVGERFSLNLNQKGISILKFISKSGDKYIHFRIVRVGAYDISYRESEVCVSFTNGNINEISINCVGNALTRCRIFSYNGEFYLAMEGGKLDYGYTNLVVTASNINFNSLFTTTSLESIPSNAVFGGTCVLNTLSKGNGELYYGGNILATGGITAYSSSDIRLKQDLRKLDYLGIIKAMGGTFSFAWKKDNTRSIGWIAQHVLCNPHLKDIVETDEKGYYKINYWSPKLIATAFGAIEQVGDEVSRLKARVVFLESEVQRLSGDKEDCNKKRLDNKNINLLN